jgi:hypothetical protein
MLKKIFAIFALLAISPLIASAMHNPSVAYCLQMGFETKIIDTPEGQYSVCVLPNGAEADSWSLINGQTETPFNYCELYGMKQQKIENGGKTCASAYSQDCFVCVSDSGAQKEMISTMQVANRFPSLDDGFRADGQTVPVAPLTPKSMPQAYPKANEKSCTFEMPVSIECQNKNTIGARPALNIVFVIDESLSAKSALLSAKGAIKNFVKSLDKNKDKVAIIGFGLKARLIQNLTSDFALAQKASDKIVSSGSSQNITGGLQRARDIIKTMPASTTAKPSRNIIILISNGVANANAKGACLKSESYPTNQSLCTRDAFVQAFSAKFLDKNPAKIYAIGYNFAQTDKIKAKAGAFARSSLKALASAPDMFFESDNLAKLSSNLTQIVKNETALIKECSDSFARIQLASGIVYSSGSILPTVGSNVQYEPLSNNVGIYLGNVAFGNKYNLTLKLQNYTGKNSGIANQSSTSYYFKNALPVSVLSEKAFSTNCK